MESTGKGQEGEETKKRKKKKKSHVPEISTRRSFFVTPRPRASIAKNCGAARGAWAGEWMLPPRRGIAIYWLDAMNYFVLSVSLPKITAAFLFQPDNYGRFPRVFYKSACKTARIGGNLAGNR